MFKLIQLGLEFFAIVKANEESYDMPITTHGFINVCNCADYIDNRNFTFKYTAILVNGLMSKELKESNELDALKKEAMELFEEAVDEEFGD